MSQSPTRSWSPELSLNMSDLAQLHSSLAVNHQGSFKSQLSTIEEEKSPWAECNQRFNYSPRTTKEGETLLVVFKDVATCAVAVRNPREIEEEGGKTPELKQKKRIQV